MHKARSEEESEDAFSGAPASQYLYVFPAWKLSKPFLLGIYGGFIT